MRPVFRFQIAWVTSLTGYEPHEDKARDMHIFNEILEY